MFAMFYDEDGGFVFKDLTANKIISDTTKKKRRKKKSPAEENKKPGRTAKRKPNNQKQ